MRHAILTAAILTAVTGIGFSAQAKTTADEFVQKAAIAGKFEIESSQLALEKSSDADVKSFANKMIADHTKADAGLRAAAGKANISDASIPSTLDEKHQDKLNKLKEAKTEDFNDDYIDAQEDAHKDAVDLFKDYAKNGDNADLKAFAAQTLPTLEEHHASVEALDKKENRQAMNKVETKTKEMGHDIKAKAIDLKNDISNKAQ